jgi:3-hydroxyisobutyrate dehydrogenase-like beta-hydroxyacid dehydrogenase
VSTPAETSPAETRPEETVGFIGVGLMGHGMAQNILEKGYPLTIMGHRNRAPIDDLVARGAREAGTAREVAQQSSVVVLCVTGSPQVEALVHGPDGLASGLAAGSVVVDCSTSEPDSTMAIAAELAEIGVAFADAPLGGTPKEAEEGWLSAIVGADDDVFRRLRPLIETWAGRAIVHIGGIGDGHRMKLLNNFLSLGYGALYAEAFTLARKVGISPQQFDSVISGGRMDCGFYQTFSRWIVAGEPESHKFTMRNALKDLTYLERMANSAGVVNPVGAAAKNSFGLAVAGGHGDDYLPHLTDVIGDLNGVPTATPSRTG